MSYVVIITPILAALVTLAGIILLAVGMIKSYRANSFHRLNYLAIATLPLVVLLQLAALVAVGINLAGNWLDTGLGGEAGPLADTYSTEPYSEPTTEPSLAGWPTDEPTPTSGAIPVEWDVNGNGVCDPDEVLEPGEADGVWTTASENGCQFDPDLQAIWDEQDRAAQENSNG